MAYRFAVDIGATRTMLALIDSVRPEVVAHDRPETDTIFTGWRSPGLALAGAVQRFLEERRVMPFEIQGVGVGVPGIVDRPSGTVLECPNLRVLDNSPLAPEASSELGIPVYIDNNTNLIALGEHTAGIGRGVDDMVVVFVGSGVGSGLILRGALYEGADGGAAEIGHTVVVPNGLACTCGGHGCLEMYCSGKALTMVANRIFKPGELYAIGSRFAGARLVIEQASVGHEAARQAMREAFTYLGIGLVNVVNTLNPRLVVLGGGIVSAWPEGVQIATEAVMTQAMPLMRRNLRIEMSQLQNYAGVLGGVALVSSEGRL
jgi:glucokinase